MSSAIRLDQGMTSSEVLDQKLEALAATERQVEVSVVMPCLNERETVGVCVRKAMAALRETGIAGEVIVADNGSTDGSVEIARAEGARVVNVEEKGYGNALKGGILASRGEYVLMADSDDSYNFAHIPRFVEQLRAGCRPRDGQPLPRWHRRPCHALPASIPGKPCSYRHWETIFWFNLRRLSLRFTRFS